MLAAGDEDWISQMYYQHSTVKSYMPLLGAPTQALSPVPAGASAAVTISEPGFVHALDAGTPATQ